MKTLWVGLAGFFGAVSRYGLGTWLGRMHRHPFPWHTFAINVSGSFALGLLFALFTTRFAHNETLRLALTVGFLGAYTTFSTFSLETMSLIDEGAIRVAIAYVAASVVAGVAAVYLGERLARAF